MARILLVEDNEMNRDMLSRRLVRNGHEVLLAIDGQQAIEVARAEQPDVVLMDLSLPVIDGWEATRRLRADPATAGLRIIALTSHAMAGDRQRAIAAGCDDYDTKPLELPRLLGKIAARCWSSGAAASCQAYLQTSSRLPPPPRPSPSREGGRGDGGCSMFAHLATPLRRRPRSSRRSTSRKSGICAQAAGQTLSPMC